MTRFRVLVLSFSWLYRQLYCRSQFRWILKGGPQGVFFHLCWAGIKNGIKYPSSSNLGIRVDNHGYKKIKYQIFIRYCDSQVRITAIKPSVLSWNPMVLWKGSLILTCFQVRRTGGSLISHCFSQIPRPGGSLILHSFLSNTWNWRLFKNQIPAQYRLSLQYPCGCCDDRNYTCIYPGKWPTRWRPVDNRFIMRAWLLRPVDKPSFSAAKLRDAGFADDIFWS